MADKIASAFDATVEEDNPKWGKGQFASHGWVEPLIVLAIMIFSLVANRRKGYRILRSRSDDRPILDKDVHDSSSSDDLLSDDDSTDQESSEDQYTGTKYPSKKRSCCGMVVYTPNSSRFSDNFHSRILQKLPYLVEMFYWILNYLFYVCTKPITTNFVMSPDTVWATAQKHGISILHFEHHTIASIFFPISEVQFQQWFMNGHLSALTFLNRAYSLIHIPGTVACLGWYYYAAPDHATFAVFRRTMTLLNFISFAIFTFWPCAPPRLLPTDNPEYGPFLDTVHHDNAESVFVQGNFVNQLAAMPSLHFGYALCIGGALIYHSGIFRRRKSTPKPMSWKKRALYVFLGIAYPAFLITVIVATANHYYLDVVVATFVLGIAFLCNRVFLSLLPVEDIFLKVVRLEKPKPTTGRRGRR
ncbi:MAG: hypothetical protein Q9227_002886 [Pyrenula ochraceoflavens]